MLQFTERELLPAAEIVQRLSFARDTFDIEGVTFLGGEPMLQARGLAQVAHAARAMSLSVMVFTGYTLDELQAVQPTAWRDLLQATDVLVDGPYLAQNPDRERRWIGSTNQGVHYLSNRYESSIERLPKEGRDVEVRFGLDGAVRINGWPVRMIRRRGA
jgi:anaerobic ribonucleoside-triphosphate reductase activating protein